MWADDINNGVTTANKASVYHDRIPQVAGVAIKGSARVDCIGLDEGGQAAYGLYADTLIDKTRDDYEDIKYRVDNKLIDSFSIEFLSKNPLTNEPFPGAVNEVQMDGYIKRATEEGVGERTPRLGRGGRRCECYSGCRSGRGETPYTGGAR